MNFTNVKTWTIQEGEVIVVKDSNNSRIIWQKQTGPDYSEPFYVQNITNNNETAELYMAIEGTRITVEYSADRTTWNTLGSTSRRPLTISLTPGQKVYLRANTNSWYFENGAAHKLHGCSKIGGNIMSLLYGSNFTGNETTFPSGSSYNFRSLFSHYDDALINAEDLLLPATTLTYGCYFSMFYDDDGLVVGPKVLPATTLTTRCYYGMFEGCDSLLQTPEIMATTMAANSCEIMFKDCTSLTQAKSLHTTTLAIQCCATMFGNCTSLTTAPELPATVLVNNCYEYMFSGCTSLNYVKCLATSGINTNYSTEHWLNNVSSTGTFVKDTNTTWPSGINGIPSNWTIQNA